MSQGKSNQNTKTKSRIAIFGAVGAAALLIIVITVFVFSRNSGKSGDTPSSGGLIIPISEVSEKAKFYPVKVDGTKMEILAVKAPDGSIRTAFNTCQVCYSSGRGYYKQEGDELICQNCGNRFGMDDVEVTRGGCNPVPITDEEKTVSETSITISDDLLKQAKSIFENWKS